jgi:hypothetical protein
VDKKVGKKEKWRTRREKHSKPRQKARLKKGGKKVDKKWQKW